MRSGSSNLHPNTQKFHDRNIEEPPVPTSIQSREETGDITDQCDLLFNPFRRYSLADEGAKFSLSLWMF
jgi:hypothetical protein